MAAFELAVQDAAGIRIAAEVGADRIELCAALTLGGLTPSPALIEHAVAERQRGGAAVHVLVRPRPGGFDYSADELDLVIADARWATDAGADGVVVGVSRDGRLDVGAIERIIAAVPGVEVTVHRVIDTVEHPLAALQSLAGTGVARVLTAGGASSVADGLPVLRDLAAAGTGIQVMAGGGVTPEIVPALLQAGVAAVHASAKKVITGVAGVELGSAPESAHYETTDPGLARVLADAVRVRAH